MFVEEAKQNSDDDHNQISETVQKRQTNRQADDLPLVSSLAPVMDNSDDEKPKY